MSRIVKLTVEHIKRVQAVHITPTGNLVEITGKNGAGKSSVLDAIAMALGGAGEIPSMPVTKGHEKGSIEIDLGDLRVKRTFTKGGTSLIVSTPEGARFQSPQQILDNLAAKLTFDPLAFIRLKREDQGKALRNLVGLDFTQSDYDRRQIYDQRTALNKTVATARAKADAIPEYPDAPATAPDTAELLAELDAANLRNQAFEAEGERISKLETDQHDNSVETAEICDEIEGLSLKIKELVAKQNVLAEEHRARAHEIEEAAFKHASTDRLDVDPIRIRIKEAGAIAEQVRTNDDRKKAYADVEKIKANSDALTAKIDALDAAKEAAIQAAKFPITGLCFDESGVVVNGIPFDQVNTAEQLRVSVAIAAAMNPKLRVMLIRHGNDLDDDGLALLGALATEHGLQVWIERIEGGVGAVVIEDGSTKNPEPAFANAAEAAYSGVDADLKEAT